MMVWEETKCRATGLFGVTCEKEHRWALVPGQRCLFFYRVYGSFGDYPAPCVDDCARNTITNGITLAEEVTYPACESEAWRQRVIDLRAQDTMGHPPHIIGARIYSQ